MGIAIEPCPCARLCDAQLVRVALCAACVKQRARRCPRLDDGGDETGRRACGLSSVATRHGLTAPVDVPPALTFRQVPALLRFLVGHPQEGPAHQYQARAAVQPCQPRQHSLRPTDLRQTPGPSSRSSAGPAHPQSRFRYCACQLCRAAFTLADITDTDAFRKLGASLAADPAGDKR
jgi:hypothetical protein